ncbi:anchored repeat ABC transporter, substrate-binding protein [Allonocardiopsis opalescens]|uniref:Anchored repeat ABC transporter substrate-binding protein n=1 Tax=Allonocardiopsis opalescens TaxID=1144618 RepID=A0A2T0Q2D2_9ACTN|nr:anchored repeat ABC transporter, substrate-binding protein [Allonocardiopsis opalescens]PRX97951.1 anchored repeat ABC transporter substrate-binding protein [Allonocardiopsis opalescens]
MPVGVHRICAAGLAVLLASGCGAAAGSDGGSLRVVASTELVADLVRQVGGERVEVTSVVPPGGDPHSYEPAPDDALSVVEADVGFGNGMLLEEQSITRLLVNNLGEGVPYVPLAEESEAHGARLIPMEENLGLDVLWLGLAVRGEVDDVNAQVHLRATGLDGPGELFVYLTDALGNPEVYIDSADGFDGDGTTLPPAAHTHVSWVFTEPGTYELTLTAELDPGDGERVPAGEAVFTFAVAEEPGAGTAVDFGHADLAVDLDTGEIVVRHDDLGDIAAEDAVLVAPDDGARLEVPDDERFAFLGEPGTPVWELPQAVLGRHVHGEIDPHLWQNVLNTKSYVNVIRDTLAEVDPDGADLYRENAAAYLAELDELHAYVGERLAGIPEENRQLITTHDAFGYLADAYGMSVAGFVVPVPGQEPSAAQVAELAETIAELGVPAVFVEPNLAARADVLRRVADDQGVDVCLVYGDAFYGEVADYQDMMRANADSLAECLR